MLPNLIIGGVFKAGTTSLFSYLSNHPEIEFSSVKEIGYFVPLQFGNSKNELYEYEKYFEHIDNKSKYILEASPGYLFGGEKIAKDMLATLGEFKIIFVLRNPIKRLVSFYNYLKTDYIYSYSDRLTKAQRRTVEKITFSQYLQRSLKSEFEKLSENEAYLWSGVQYGLYADYLEEWCQTISNENIKVIFFEELFADEGRVISDICSWLDIDNNLYNQFDFSIHNKSVAFKSKTIFTVASRLNRKAEFFFRKYPATKRKLHTIYSKLNGKPIEKSDFIITREVNDIYKADKKKLELLLNRDINIW